MNEYYGENDWRDYLAHHGILGMKWGKRNGPPYPLGASDHSASEKKAGWRKSLNKLTKKSSSKSSESYNSKTTQYKPNGYDEETINQKMAAARNNDRYDVNFLETIQNEDDGMTQSIRLKEYERYLKNPSEYMKNYDEEFIKNQVKEVENQIKEVTKDCWNLDYQKYRNDPEERDRANKAADLGLEAINKIRGNGYIYKDADIDYYVNKYGLSRDEASKQILKSNREWFLFEDQTIGLPMIADLVNQGYSSEKISEMIDTVNKNYTYHLGENPVVFNIQESNYANENKKFAEACEEVNKRKGDTR